ncbi:MAG: hypothetical protein KA821_13310 [Chitinophagaceae bacterium]|nr:hypothetical protein [Chitinophagaceae bacterium]
MKYIFPVIVFLTGIAGLSAQEISGIQYLKGKIKGRVYYARLQGNEARLFKMGRYLDKAGTGFSIVSTDTLHQQSDGVFANTKTQMRRDEDVYEVTIEGKKENQLELKPADAEKVKADINNGYYLKNYFAMADELNAEFQMQHYSFRGGFWSWDSMNDAHKRQDVDSFRKNTDAYLQQLRDSVGRLHTTYENLTGTLLEKMPTLEYATLLEGLKQLPAEWAGTSHYFSTVIHEVSAKRPEFFFRLAQDLPASQRSLIFFSASKKKDVRDKLRAVDADAAIKKDFFGSKK